MMSYVVLEIPGRPPNPNDGNRGRNASQHWAVQRRTAKAWRETAALVARAARPSRWVPLESARMLVTFVVPDKRKRDLDNLVASTKPLTDGLVDAGLLVDDSTAVLVQVAYRVRIQKGVHSTIYEIWAET